MTKKLSLVKYAGEFWFTLSDFSQTRDTAGYSGEASVKSAIRTQVVKHDPDKYIAFRGELQIKNIVQENKNNPLFNEEDFQGTRQALIHWSMLDQLRVKFSVAKEYELEFPVWLTRCQKYMLEESKKQEVAATVETVNPIGNIIEARSIMLRQMRQELNSLYKSRETIDHNIEKLNQAIASIESLKVEE
jgi:hypothetical protein